jgi:hypothetical protein
MGGKRHEAMSTRRDFAGSARPFESGDTTVSGTDGGASSLTSAVLGSLPIHKGSSGVCEGTIVLHLGN